MEKIILNPCYTEDEIQTFAEANYGRELTETEICRLDYSWDDDNVSWSRAELMANAIECVMDNENNEWKSVDENYKSNVKQDEQ
jgi:hypothetical protein